MITTNLVLSIFRKCTYRTIIYWFSFVSNTLVPEQTTSHAYQMSWISRIRFFCFFFSFRNFSLKTYRWSWNTCVPLTIINWCDVCCEIGAKYVMDCCWFGNPFGSALSGDALRSSLAANGSYRLHSKLFGFSSFSRCCSSVIFTNAEITWSFGCVFRWSCRFMPTCRYSVHTGHCICESKSIGEPDCSSLFIQKRK